MVPCATIHSAVSAPAPEAKVRHPSGTQQSPLRPQSEVVQRQPPPLQFLPPLLLLLLFHRLRLLNLRPCTLPDV